MWIIFINQTTTVGGFTSKRQALDWGIANLVTSDWYTIKVTNYRDFPTR